MPQPLWLVKIGRQPPFATDCRWYSNRWYCLLLPAIELLSSLFGECWWLLHLIPRKLGLILSPRQHLASSNCHWQNKVLLWIGGWQGRQVSAKLSQCGWCTGAWTRTTGSYKSFNDRCHEFSNQSKQFLPEINRYIIKSLQKAGTLCATPILQITYVGIFWCWVSIWVSHHPLCR